jgi:hypothetical protein
MFNLHVWIDVTRWLKCKHAKAQPIALSVLYYAFVNIPFCIQIRPFLSVRLYAKRICQCTAPIRTNLHDSHVWICLATSAIICCSSNVTVATAALIVQSWSPATTATYGGAFPIATQIRFCTALCRRWCEGSHREEAISQVAVRLTTCKQLPTTL